MENQVLKISWLFLFIVWSTDPYVKVWLMFGEKKVEKKKTPVYKCNLNPTFNQVNKKPILQKLISNLQTFEFDVPWEQIRDCSLDISVMDFDTIGRNEMIGKLLLSCKYFQLNCNSVFRIVIVYSSQQFGPTRDSSVGRDDRKAKTIQRGLAQVTFLWLCSCFTKRFLNFFQA